MLLKKKDSSRIANTYLLLSTVYAYETKMDSTKIVINEALKIAKSINNERLIINCYDLLAGYMIDEASRESSKSLKNSLLRKSNKYFFNALNYTKGKRIDTIVYYEIYKLIAKNYEKLAKMDSALIFYNNYISRFEYFTDDRIIKPSIRF